MPKSILLLISFTLLLSCGVYAAPVKLTSSGICHPPESSYYQRIERFKSFKNTEQCLAAGGRLPKTLNKRSSAAPSAHYQRSEWPHWLDEDNDCQDARAETLIATSRAKVTFSGQQTCSVTHGVWQDPYSGKTFTDDNDLDIDHVVPLKFAHDRGAAQWSKRQKARFANDPDNLLAVDNGLNRSKGAKGPSEWMPPNHAYRCAYLAHFDKVMHKYQLTYTSKEQRVLNKMRQACSTKLASGANTIH